MRIEGTSDGTWMYLKGSSRPVKPEPGWIVTSRDRREHFLPAREYRRTPEKDPNDGIRTFAHRVDVDVEFRFDTRRGVTFTTVRPQPLHACPSCRCDGETLGMVPESDPSPIDPAFDTVNAISVGDVPDDDDDDACGYCVAATGSLRAASGDPAAVMLCTRHGGPAPTG